MRWTEDMATGDPAVDLEHFRAFELAESAGRARSSDQHVRLVMQLLAHFRLHLSREEELMAKAGYPRLERHRKAHDAMLDEVVGLAEGRLARPEDGARLERFAEVTLRSHILEEDGDFWRFVRTGRTREAG